MKRRIFSIALLVPAFGALVWLGLRPHEPVYQGKSLTVWADTYYFGTRSLGWYSDDGAAYSQPVREAQAALRHIGTNAIPDLLRMLRAHDADWKLKVIALVEKQRLITIKHVTAAEKNNEAAAVFRILGASASNAVPALIKIFDQRPFGAAQNSAGAALAHIGPPARAAIPTLLRGMTNDDIICRLSSIRALGQIHEEPDLVLPVLLRCVVADTNWGMALRAVTGIGNFGPAARRTVPALLAEATNSASIVRFEAMKSLGKIQAEPETVVPALIQCLGETNMKTQGAAAEALGSFGADAKAAVPLLLELMKNPDGGVRYSAIKAVAKIDPQNLAVVLALAHALHDQIEGNMFTAATCLVEIGPPARAAVPELVKALQDSDSSVRFEAANALKKIDPEAAAKAGIK